MVYWTLCDKKLTFKIISMEKFCEFQIHEYMDMYPEKYVRTFIADDEDAIRTEAIKWADYMKHNYSGGTTSFVCVMSAEEARAYAESLIKEEMDNPRDDSKEFTDHIKNLYNKCYKENQFK